MKDHRSADRIRRRRQDPVSCQLCRSKKLKCDRQQPCSNCLARGTTCEGVHVVDNHRGWRGNVSNDQNAAVLGRLQKLEEAVFGEYALTPPSLYQNSESRYNTPGSHFAGDEDAEAVFSEFEVTGTREDSLLSGLSEGIVFSIEATHQISGTQLVKSYAAGHHPKTISMPPKEEAILLFQNYTENIECFYHVILIPCVRRLLDVVYEKILQRQPFQPSYASLLLSIFATSKSNQNATIGGNLSSQDQRDTAKAALSWCKAALDVLEHSRRTSRGSLEDVQASIILLFLTSKNEGLSIRCRYLLNNALTIARDLSLHKVDICSRRKLTADVSNDLAELELKRRVWWHIVSTDWLQSGMGGPTEGTYTLHPGQMCVKMPRNINDEDLDLKHENFQRPDTEPTSMSYLIYRIRIAEICRIIVDRLPPLSSDPKAPNYEDIVALDGKIENFLHELPIFLRFDEDSRLKSQDIYTQFPQLVMQRYTVNIIANSLRCKLNRPFLIRGSLDNHFALTRARCLCSARTVIEIGRQLAKPELTVIPFMPTHGRLAPCVHVFFVATLVLVIDLCFNQIPAQKKAARAEVADACKLLEDTKAQAPVAGKFLESLSKVMRKYDIEPLPLLGQANANNEKSPEGDKIMMATASKAATEPPFETSQNYYGMEMQTDPQQYPVAVEDIEFDFDEIWRDYVDFGPNIDVPIGNPLFGDFEPMSVP